MFASRSNVLSQQPNGTASTSTAHLKASIRSSGRFPHRLSFYDVPPTEEITTDEFESWAIDRLRILADIESSEVRNRSYEDLKTNLQTRLKQYLPLSSNTARGVDLDAERRKDLVGHYVLRLAFCRSEELRARFIKAEKTLFRVRWDSDDSLEREVFLKSLNFDWQTVTDSEKQAFKEQLLAAAPHLKDLREKFDSESYFKVPWMRVCDLVAQRKVFLRGGFAYVPARDQFSLISAEYGSRLSRALEHTCRALPRLDEDDRLVPVLEHLSMGFLAGVTSEYAPAENAAQGVVTAGMIDELAKKHFPMCMRNLHDHLRENKHLKHWGRLQYRLFLKGVGLPVEEALVFWRKAFSSMTDDKFGKEHKYGVRHSYGLEGGRKNYAPKSCQQIITGTAPGPGEAHGCPFRHFSESHLSSTLSVTYRLQSTEQREILDAVKSQHYHVACTRLYEITHRDQGVKKGDGIGPGGESVSHPNLYTERSRALEMSDAPKVEVKMDVD